MSRTHLGQPLGSGELDAQFKRVGHKYEYKHLTVWAEKAVIHVENTASLCDDEEPEHQTFSIEDAARTLQQYLDGVEYHEKSSTNGSGKDQAARNLVVHNIKVMTRILQCAIKDALRHPEAALAVQEKREKLPAGFTKRNGLVLPKAATF